MNIGKCGKIIQKPSHTFKIQIRKVLTSVKMTLQLIPSYILYPSIRSWNSGRDPWRNAEVELTPNGARFPRY